MKNNASISKAINLLKPVWFSFGKKILTKIGSKGVKIEKRGTLYEKDRNQREILILRMLKDNFRKVEFYLK